MKSLARTLFILFLTTVVACSEEKEHTAAAIHDRDSVSMMVSYGVNTLISDSGITKYRIVAETWDVNTVREPSRWTFINGVFFEQFDEKFHIQAYVQADTAWYYDKQKLWELRGRVCLRNVNGMIFRSEELFWDGFKHEIYSYKFSRLFTPERTMEGTYFRSDENMNHYTISNSVGSFVKSDFENSDTATAPAAVPGDTTIVIPQQRPAAQKHKASPKPIVQQ